jgi:hypothetical protein
VNRKTTIILTPADDVLLAKVKKLFGLTSTIATLRLALTLAAKTK